MLFAQTFKSMGYFQTVGIHQQVRISGYLSTVLALFYIVPFHS
jgi:hypothetical protein